jgi:phosphoribosylformylglycinamidine synthase
VRFDVRVEVRLRPGIADPQGATIERALPALGFDGVDSVRVGKSIRFTVDAPDETSARTRAAQMAERLLANPVIEDADVEILADTAIAETV